MIATSYAKRNISCLNPRGLTRLSSWHKTARLPASANASRRCFHDGKDVAPRRNTNIAESEYLKEYKGAYNVSTNASFFDFESITDHLNTETVAAGFLVSTRRLSDSLLFATLRKGIGKDVQILVRDPEMVKKVGSTNLYSAVSVTGTLQLKRQPKNKAEGSKEGPATAKDVELVAEEFVCLNSFSEDIPSGPDRVHPPTSRHLQIRFDPKLQAAILFRSEVLKFARKGLADFTEVETPILFKSTPEGAREFLVPTRRAGRAYALPQSPQQYKQILMASGIEKYVQFARCFRDEDLRSDRQPEFTQIDLEMAWTDGEGVMKRVEQFVKDLYCNVTHPAFSLPSLDQAPFYRMDYDEAMTEHGSDKPDLRIPGLIHRIDHIVPKQLLGMITHLENPIIEAYKIRLDGTPQTIQTFLRDFFKTTEGQIFDQNPHGVPGISIYDPRKPLEGLQTFGFEGAELIKDFYGSLPKGRLDSEEEHKIASTLDEGDLLLLQARSDLSHSGGSTPLGDLRRAIYQAAVSRGLLKADPRHLYLWVTGFPMFTPENGVDPGQGGRSKFSATHHPFTAPKTAADVDLLISNPLKAKADHYDLVVNGVELGGGSRRIHSAEMQKFVMRDVLKMRDERINDFDHLLKSLAAGCPPHAGFAFGFDRLMAVLCGTDSVRDVIAFPKNGSGDDLMVGSPGKIGSDDLKPYHLKRD